MGYMASMEAAMSRAMSQVPVTDDPLTIIAAAIEHLDAGRVDPAGACLLVLAGEWGMNDSEDPRLDIIETAALAAESGDYDLARDEMVKLQAELAISLSR